MRLLLTTCLLAILTVTLASCSQRESAPTLNGWISFINESDQKLTGVEVSGFERNPPCGNLVVDANASAMMYDQSIPADIEIDWIDSAGIAGNAVVTIPSPPQGNVKRDLNLTFTPESNWVATWTTR